MTDREIRLQTAEPEETIESLRELVMVLHSLPQREREKFYYMAQGAALVLPQDEQGRAG